VARRTPPFVRGLPPRRSPNVGGRCIQGDEGPWFHGGACAHHRCGPGDVVRFRCGRVRHSIRRQGVERRVGVTGWGVPATTYGEMMEGDFFIHNEGRKRERSARTPHQGWCGELPHPVTAIALGPAYTPFAGVYYLASMLTPALRVGEPDPQAPWTAPV